MENKVCFVIMGYGVKTDYPSGRVLDLNKTYENLIKPAVEDLGIKCIRADEIRHTGNIDVPMYKYILEADIVIADLSTYNPNTFYELGVRHALRPYTTIAISENELNPPFDINHTVIHQYEHLGKDIGVTEATRFKKELKELINEILSNPKTDSPVYTFLNYLKHPEWGKLEEVVEEVEREEVSLNELIQNANDAIKQNNFRIAKIYLEEALKIDASSHFIIQKLALVTYKSRYPDHISSLEEALQILESLKPVESTDPETLGLTGAIYKRLWEEKKDIELLNMSIYFYEKGFYIKNDYYNGINLAYMLNERAVISELNDSIADNVLANRIRKQVIKICERLLNGKIADRDDKYWILATLEEALFGLGETAAYNHAKKNSEVEADEEWKRKSTLDQIRKLELLLKGS